MKKLFPVEELARDDRFRRVAIAERITDGRTPANAENQEGGADVDDLVVSKIFVNEGPREKRVQPAPMGRAYRIIKRRSHVTVELSDAVQAEGRRGREAAAAKAKSKAKTKAKPAAKARPRRK